MTRGSAPLCAFLALGLLAVPPVVTTEGAQPTFRGGVVMVQFSMKATVGDRPVTDLRASEMTVFDNDTPAELVHFRRMGPATASEMPRARHFVLVLDDLHISPRLTGAVRRFAHRLISTVEAGDLLAIATTGPAGLHLPLSTDRLAARTLVDRFLGQRSAMMPEQRVVNSETAYRLVGQLGAMLRHERLGRSTIVLVSEGHILPPDRSPSSASHDARLADAYYRLLRAMYNADAAVHAVDPRGLEAPFPEIGTRGFEDTAAVAARTAETVAANFSARRFGSLRRIAESTGGTFTTDDNNVESHVSAIVSDGLEYYEVGYVQPDVPPRERMRARSIRVTTTRPAVSLRHRREYVSN